MGARNGESKGEDTRELKDSVQKNPPGELANDRLNDARKFLRPDSTAGCTIGRNPILRKRAVYSKSLISNKAAGYCGRNPVPGWSSSKDEAASGGSQPRYCFHSRIMTRAIRLAASRSQLAFRLLRSFKRELGRRDLAR